MSEPIKSPDLNASESASTPSLQALVENLQEQIALLATLTEGGVKPKTEAACTECARQAQYNDELSLQVAALRQGWIQDKSKYVQASLDLQQVQHVVEACNVTFQKLHRSQDGFLADGLPLSQIAVETIATYCDERRKQHWDETSAAIDRKKTKLKKRKRDLVGANQIFHERAALLNTELFRFKSWLDMTHRSLEDKYQRYCQIMREHGAKPEVLYEDQEALSEAEASYIDAWTARMDAAHKATETAHLYGLSEPFEDMDEV